MEKDEASILQKTPTTKVNIGELGLTHARLLQQLNLPKSERLY